MKEIISIFPNIHYIFTCIKYEDGELQIQATARDHHVKQLAEMEKKCHETIRQTQEVFDLVNKVEINVGAASRFHKKLAYYNEHQKCQLLSYKQGMASKQQELAGLKISVENLKTSLTTAQHNGCYSEQSEKELRMQTELCRHLENQLNEARKENKNLIDSLKEAHILVDKHVGIASKHCELESLAQFELDEAISECDNLKKELVELKKALEISQHEADAKLETCKAEKERSEKQLADILSRHEALILAHNTLEDKNCKLSQQISEMTNEKEKLLDKEREHIDALEDSSIQIEKMKEDHQNEILGLKEELVKARCQALEESDTIKLWKEKLANSERKAEEIAINLNEIKKNKETETISRITQTNQELLNEPMSTEENLDTDFKTENIYRHNDVDRPNPKTHKIVLVPSKDSIDGEKKSTEAIVESNHGKACTEGMVNANANGNVDTSLEVKIKEEITVSGDDSVATDYNPKDFASTMESKKDNTGSTKGNPTAKDGKHLVGSLVKDINGSTGDVAGVICDVHGTTTTTATTDNANESMIGESTELACSIDIDTTAGHVSLTMTSAGVTSTAENSSELRMFNQETLSNPFHLKSFEKDDKLQSCEQTEDMCFTILREDWTASLIPFPRNDHNFTERQEGKEVLDQASITAPSLVPINNSLKSCLRDKSINKETHKPSIYKKLRFDLSANESQTEVLQADLESNKDEKLSKEGKEKENMDPGVPISTSTQLTDNEEKESHCVGTATPTKQPIRNGTNLSHAVNKQSNEGGYSTEEQKEKIDEDESLIRHTTSALIDTNSDYQELFSDDDDEGKTVITYGDVGQQIRRIQRFLYNERLRTNRKRKFPDGLVSDNK